MKKVSSLHPRDKNSKIVRRGRKIYVINKVKPRCKARQGS
ncbi:MAG: 50S ribosomal protein L36 [Wolbachia sp.]|nr:50S ribosomal protein L36 [Wolbachia sp.]MDD9336097.1 50S ribosomal protein L36 [Wolbachia sp.]